MGEDRERSPEATNLKESGDREIKNFDIREHDLKELSNSELVEAIGKELQVQRTKIENMEVQLENGDHLDFSSLEKFTVTDSDGEPTPEAEKLRKEVIWQGRDGLTTGEIEEKLGVSNPTASNKMNQMADTFEDLEVYDPRNTKGGKYNQPKRLRHKKAAVGKSPKEIFGEEQDKKLLECPNCEQEPIKNAKKVWRERLEWECPACGEEIPEEMR